MNAKLSEKAISYIRFSSAKQELGDSLRRQTEAAVKYARDKGLDLDLSLSVADLGLSGYKGLHLSKGAFGLLVDAIDKGTIKLPLHLIVENFDRLSRLEPSEGFDVVFRSLINKGVIIHTIGDNQVYSRESLASNPMQYLIIMMHLIRSNSESKIKSERVRQAWQNIKKETVKNKKHIASRYPYWLKKNDKGEFEFNEHYKTIRTITELFLKGYSCAKIAKHLNDNNISTLASYGSGRWDSARIQKLFARRTLLGYYQPGKYDSGKYILLGDEVKIYPEAVTQEEYYKIRSILSTKTIKTLNNKGRQGRMTNVFSKRLSFLNGSTARIIRIQKNTVPCIVSSKSITTDKEQVTSFNYNIFETLILAMIGEHYKPNPQATSDIDVSPIESEIAAIEEKTTKIQQMIVNGSVNAIEMHMQTIENLSQKKRDLKAKLDEMNQAIAMQSSSNISDGISQIHVLALGQDIESRTKLKQIIYKIIEKLQIKITCPKSGYKVLHGLMDLTNGERYLIRIAYGLKRMPRMHYIQRPNKGTRQDALDKMETAKIDKIINLKFDKETPYTSSENCIFSFSLKDKPNLQWI